MNCRFHLFRSSASSFNSKYLLLFLKLSRSCIPPLPTPLTSVICPSMASWRRQFLRIWSIQLAFLRKILFRIFLFSPIRTRTSLYTLTILSSPFSYSTTCQRSPDNSAPSLLVSITLGHLKQIMMAEPTSVLYLYIYLFILISGRKTPEYKFSGRDFKHWVPNLRFQDR